MNNSEIRWIMFFSPCCCQAASSTLRWINQVWALAKNSFADGWELKWFQRHLAGGPFDGEAVSLYISHYTKCCPQSILKKKKKKIAAFIFILKCSQKMFITTLFWHGGVILEPKNNTLVPFDSRYNGSNFRGFRRGKEAFIAKQIISHFWRNDYP